MIETYYPSSPYGTCPSEPFVYIGEIIHQYSTGTQYERVYSDDPKADIPQLLGRSAFKLASNYAAKIELDGIMFSLELFRKLSQTEWEYLAMPPVNAKEKVRTKLIVLPHEDVKKIILKQLEAL